MPHKTILHLYRNVGENALVQEAADEQLNGRDRADDGAAGVKVEALLQRVDVDDEDVGRAAAAGRNGREEHGHGVCSGDLAFDLHALHSARGVVAALGKARRTARAARERRTGE